MVGRPAWCHILGEKKVSTRSPNPGFDAVDGFEVDWLEVGFEDEVGEMVFDVVLGFLNDEDPNFSLHPYVSGFKLTNEHLISFFAQ